MVFAVLSRTASWPQPHRPCCAPTQPRASVADFYKGKNVDLYVGYEVGGAYDLYARMVAKHIGKHIPGNPTVIRRTWRAPSAPARQRRKYNVAPKDGSAISIIGAAPASIRCSATPRRSSPARSSPGSRTAPTTKCRSASPGTPPASPSSTAMTGDGGRRHQCIRRHRSVPQDRQRRARHQDEGGHQVSGGNESASPWSAARWSRCGWSWSSVKSTSPEMDRR